MMHGALGCTGALAQAAAAARRLRPLLLLAALLVISEGAWLHAARARARRCEAAAGLAAAEAAALLARAPLDADADAAVGAYLDGGGSVVGVMFFGRRRFVAVGLPYLLAARRVPGQTDSSGVLDHVLLIINTADGDDLAFASDVAAVSDGFVRLVHAPALANASSPSPYCSMYRLVRDQLAARDGSNTILLKLDDDLVYFAPDALRRLVARRITASADTLLVSANVVNHPLLAHVHQRTGLLSPDDALAASVAADASRPPAAAQLGAPLPSAVVPGRGEALGFPYEPLSETGWRSGAHAALQHLLLLWRIAGEGGGVLAYTRAFHTWEFDAVPWQRTRWSINAVALWAAALDAFDEAACRGSVDDEAYLTEGWPAALGARSVAAGDALVAHYAYFPQRAALEASDVLPRYAELAAALAARLHEDGAAPTAEALASQRAMLAAAAPALHAAQRGAHS